MSRIYRKRTCIMCGKEYTPTSSGQRFCGNWKDYSTCAGKHRAKRDKAYNRSHYSPEYHKKRYNKDQRLNSHLKKQYGLTLEDKQKMLESQNYRCAIGMEKIDINSACVDHCHKTGKVRALLCKKHNLLLGYASDDPLILGLAIEYIDKYNPENRSISFSNKLQKVTK